MRSENAIMTSRREFLSNALGITLVSGSIWPIRADQARSMHGQSDSSTSNSGRTTKKFIPEVGRVSDAQHTRYHERFASGRKRAAVAAYFVNAYFWGARRCPGRRPHYGRAGACPGELGCGERKESDDDLRHPWPRRPFLWHQYSSGAISKCPLCR